MKELRVNYYSLLELSPDKDPANDRDRKEIEKLLAARYQQWNDELGRASPRRESHLRLCIAAHRQMRADLAASPAMWKAHADAYRKILAQRQVRRASALNEFLDVLGAPTLEARLRTSLVRLAGDQGLVDTTLAQRKIAVEAAAKSQQSSEASGIFDTVMKTLSQLEPLLDELGCASAYELIAEYSGQPVTAKS